MRLRKLRRFCLIFLMAILGVLILVFAFINLPFSQRFATRQVNQILSQVDVPIHIDAIRKILSGSVNVQGVVIADHQGDTIIYAGELQADIRLVALLRSKVVLRDLELDRAVVDLARKSGAEKLNIAAAFQSRKREDVAPSENEPASWEISIKKGELSHISFRMTDSIAGIHIYQDVSEIDIRGFRISLFERDIFCKTLDLSSADGSVNLTPRLMPIKEKTGSPWNLGLLNLLLNDIDFTFHQPSNGLKLETKVGEGSIRANKLELLSRTVDLRKISLKDATAAIHSGNRSKKSKDHSVDKESQFKWNISSDAIDVENSTAMLGTEPGAIYSGIDLNIKDFRLDNDQAGMKVRKMNFEVGNGFSLKNVKGELDSYSDQTQLHMKIETGNSHIGLEGYAEERLLDIIKRPGEIEKATMKIEQTQVSLSDLSCFIAELEESPLYAALSSSPIDMEGNLTMDESVFSFAEVSVSQQRNFNMALEGNVENPFRFSEATGELDLKISGIDQAWVERLATGFGIEDSLPDLSDLQIQGHISDSLKAPDIHIALTNNSGSVDIAGSIDLNREIFKLGCSFHSVDLGDLLLISEMGSFAGTGEIKGAGFPGENLNASFYLQIDTLGFNDYNYSQILLAGTLEPGEYELHMVAKDSSLKGDLNVVLNLADSAIGVNASGVILAQLNNLHLYDDTLAVETTVEAHLTLRGNELESDISASEVTFTTPQETAVVQQLNAHFRTDTVETLLYAEADFFNVDMLLLKPLNELDSLGEGYKNYFASFTDPSHMTAADRVSALPEISATGQISHHKVLNIFMEDAGLHFTNLDISIIHPSDENSLNTHIKGDEITYKMVKTGSLNAAITDSAGMIIFELIADKTSLFSGPESRLQLTGNFTNRSTLTTLSVDDSLNHSVYYLEVAGKVDSNQIVLEIPAQQFTMNREQWQMESPDLLSIDLATKKVSTALRINEDSSFIHVNTLNQDPFTTYKFDLSRVELGSLLSSDLFPGRPEGTISGFIDFSTNRDIEKRIVAGLQICDINYSGQDISDIQLDGSLSLGQSDDYSIDLVALMDSSNVELKSGKAEGGNHHIDAAFFHFPLVTIQPFTSEYLSDLGGFISGKFNSSSHKGSELYSGELMFEDARLKVNLLNSAFRIPPQHILIADERVVFNNFTVLDTLNRELNVDGYIELGRDKPISADLNISSSKLQVMSRDKKSTAPFTGNVFVDSRFSVKGPLTKPEVKGKILLSEGTEIFYQHMEDLRHSESEKIVNFVNQAATGEEIRAPMLSRQSNFMNSSIETIVEIDPTTRINFTLTKRMFNIDLDVKGGGQVQYNMLENEQVTLLGRYEIGEGAALLKLTGWPNKSFRIAEGGYIRWDGKVENPDLRFEAENRVSSSYINPIDGNRREIEFNVILQISGYLSDLNVLFTIRTPDQYVMSVINTMSPEEQMQQAISVLLFETIDLPGVSSSTDYMTQQVNQILASQLNRLTKSAIKGVDISFGLDSYNQSPQEGGESTTSLSYEVRKSLLNNRAQIEFSGRLHDVNQQPGASDLSLNNVSFEYRLDSAATKYLKVYNEHTYDDVFEGEVIKTGIGFTYRKRYRSLSDIWRRKR